MTDAQTPPITELEAGHGCLSFTAGSPGTQTLNACKEIMRKASEDVLRATFDTDRLFQYGPMQGDPGFREQLSKFLSLEYGDSVHSSDLIVTAGASQGLCLILSLLCEKSGPVFVEDPSYFCGFRVIRDDFGMELVTVPCDNNGIQVSAADDMITLYKSKTNVKSKSSKRFWASMYLIPVFGNPVGWTYTSEQCQQLIQLARKHDILLIAEDVYNLLYFTESNHPPPRLISFDKKSDADFGRGHVVSNGTFSKILAPSLRVGWIEGPDSLLSILYEGNMTCSGGSFNHFTSLLIESVLQSEVLHQHVTWLRKVYKERLNTMCNALDELMPKECSYQKPDGGFFLWLKLHTNVDASEFLNFSMKSFAVSFLPGICTSPSEKFRNYARLSVSVLDEATIKKGIKKLSEAYQEFTQSLAQ